jgi:hypothetical protein
MFIVLELQATSDDVAHIFTTYDTQAEAESSYHLVLSAAAVSTVPEHSVLLMTPSGQVLRSETYSHESE